MPAHLLDNRQLSRAKPARSDGLGYNAANEYIPKETRLASLSDLTCTYTRTKGTIALSWNDPNGDLMETITIQCKRPGETLYSNVGTVTPKDKNSKDGVSYSFTEEISDPGVYTYRIKAVSYNNKSFYTDDATVNVDPAQGTKDVQFGKLTVNNADENKIYYSTPFEESTPFVFIGTMTNKNTKFYAGNITKSNSKTNFTYQPLPWKDNTGTLSSNEEIPFLALQGNFDSETMTYSPRHYQYGDLDCEVGLVSSNKATGEDTWTDVTEVTFQQPFPAGVTPVILTEIRNPNYSTGNNTTSLNVRVFDVTNTGFKFIIYSEASTARKIAISQSVCYLAITPGIGSLDEENGLIIAAGLGEENMIGGISARDNNFYVQKGEEKEILLFYQPTILVAMQTNNYPAASMLRRTDITLKDDEGTTWTAGVKIKRILDHDLTVDGSTIKTTTLDDAYQDKIGWVVIAKYKEGGSAPSAISTINAQPQKGTLSPRIVNGRIYVDGANHFEVYSPTGARVNATSALTTGIYVVKANGQSAKILVK